MISKRAKEIKPSATLSVTAKAKEMKNKGVDVISFGAGEPDFDTPEYIKRAAIKAIRDGFTKYTPSSGILELKQAICKKLKRDNGLIYKPSNVLVSNGAKQCLYNLLQVLIDPDEEVLLPLPSWVSYEEMVKMAGGKPVFIKTRNFKLTAEGLRRRISNRSKVLILNSPSNPTGVVYTRGELMALADVCLEKNLVVISDEVYEKIVYERKHVSIASLNNKIKELTFVVNGVSKAYAMTGWRIGYCAGDEKVIKAAGSLQSHTTSNPNSIAQKAALAALNGSETEIMKMVSAYKRRRDYMVERLNKIDGFKVAKPDGAFYLFVRVKDLYNPRIKTSLDFCQALLNKKHVAAIPGSPFGDDGYIRLSYATSMDNIKKGLDRLEEFVNQIRD